MNWQFFNETMAGIQDMYVLAQEEVRALLGLAYSVDEMALYFATEKEVYSYMAQALQHGWLVFNHAEDQVTTRPILGQYSVRYWFMRHEDKPYRLELMVVDQGYSPFHGALQYFCERRGAPALAHASFKVPDEAKYANAVRVLREAGHELCQHCTSSYGKFSYFLSDDGQDIPAIKPRLNIRDAVSVV